MGFFRTRCLVGIVAASLLSGCSQGDRPKLGTVTGTVYLDDEPLPNVWIMFSPTTGRTSLGRTNDEGRYELMYLEGVKGANTGTHKVVIMTYHEDEIVEMRANNEPVNEPIPAKYNAQSTLVEEVQPGENVIDFHLESE